VTGSVYPAGEVEPDDGEKERERRHEIEALTEGGAPGRRDQRGSGPGPDLRTGVSPGRTRAPDRGGHRAGGASPHTTILSTPYPAPTARSGGSHGDTWWNAVPGRAFRRVRNPIGTLAPAVRVMKNRCATASILNYRHSHRRRSSIVFRTARAFASPGTVFPGIPVHRPHPLRGGGFEEERMSTHPPWR
jgi:hypothetical protein